MQLQPSDIKVENKAVLARAISMVENQAKGFESLLLHLPDPGKKCQIIGITGPPGAGKSTLTDALIELFLKEDQKVAVVCIDPSSPFHKGAILGDRIRMNAWHDHPNVFIRSMASRGALGGVAPMVIEVVEVLQSAGFDKILIETVGVGQSEVEIAGLADTTIVVLVPESGDDVQSMKSGLMEIADIFVVNKTDRPAADLFIQHLQGTLTIPGKAETVPVIPTIASKKTGIQEIKQAIENHENSTMSEKRKNRIICDKVIRIIQKEKLKNIDIEELMDRIEKEKKPMNLYAMAQLYL